MSLSWIFQGIEYPLDDGETAWHIGNDMFGLPPFIRFESRGPLQHGSTDEGYILEPRIVPIAAAVSADSWEELWIKRTQLINMFKPTDINGVLRWNFGGRIRDLDAYCIGGLNFATTDRVGLVQKFGIDLKANDPTWYDPTPVELSFIMGGVGAGMPVPTPVPTPIGNSNIGQSLVVNYVGSAISYPHIVRVEGPIDDPIVENESSGHILDFTGLSLAVGEWLQMDLRYNHKTIVNQAGTNMVNELTTDSDLSTFAIFPNPDVPDGVNSIVVSGSGTSDLTRIDVIFYTRDIGI